MLRTAGRRTAGRRWGLAGAGTLYYCPEDDSVLLLKRSSQVEDPGMWGIPGGAVKSGRTDVEGIEDEWYENEDVAPDYSEEELRGAAMDETEEELGYIPEHDSADDYHTTVNNNFPYTTFLMVVTSQQKTMISRNIRLNWESDEDRWFGLKFLPRNIHPGVIAAIQQLILNKRNENI